MRQFMMKVLFKHEWITFIWMGVFFVAFGVSSLNLFMLFKANFDLYLEHGAMVIDDGALRQLLELIAYGYLSLLFYLLFQGVRTGSGRASDPGRALRAVNPARRAQVH